jgi:hypothetical protein
VGQFPSDPGIPHGGCDHQKILAALIAMRLVGDTSAFIQSIHSWLPCRADTLTRSKSKHKWMLYLAQKSHEAVKQGSTGNCNWQKKLLDYTILASLSQIESQRVRGASTPLRLVLGMY